MLAVMIRELIIQFATRNATQRAKLLTRLAIGAYYMLKNITKLQKIPLLPK